MQRDQYPDRVAHARVLGSRALAVTMDPVTKFRLEQIEELKALVLERSLLKAAAEATQEAYARSNERVEFYLKSMK